MMPVDPTEPEVPATDDAQEIHVEAPEADAHEQRAPIAPGDAVEEEAVPPLVPDPFGVANEADRAEQARIVELDEDEYR
ncbi:hypothetical protein ACFV3R_13420 [Streptomyces sp. NPDC059740]|uniref:hypothetical protein n=1 Tax=Streptomyces sp. NPDC059740 TaxID=3346926 RepID=UPI00364B595C